MRKLCLALILCLTGCSFSTEPTQTEIAEIQQRITAPETDAQVREIYTARQFRPVWIARGKKLDRLKGFFEFVKDSSHGVHTDVAQLETEPSDLTQFDIDVTTALTRHASAIARQDALVPAVVSEAIDAGTVAQLGDRLAPAHIEYRRLRHALMQERPPAEMETIRVNMDRWRKLPDDLGYEHIRVNIPAFELEVHEGEGIPLRMKVVVGTTENKTPVLSSEMKQVVFSPYWNIPESITTKEMLPKILKDPDYASRQNLEVVRVSGGGTQVVDPDKIDWERVNANEIQLRQKPGPGNSLGLVKFLFPNRFHVYLHDTPADNLFDRLTRTFSHGCVRVEKPQELAEYALRDQSEWTPERIRAAMRAGRESSVEMKRPLPVHFLYFTAVADENGHLLLLDDIYKHDLPVPL